MPDAFDPSLLSGYLDNELTADETAVVKRALADNADLRQELDEIRKLRAAVAALPMPPINDRFVEGVRQRIEQQQAVRLSPLAHGAPQTLKMLLSFAVAACVLLAVGWTILQNRPQTQSVVLDQAPSQPPQVSQTPSQTTDRQPRQDESAEQRLGDSRSADDAMLADAMLAPGPRSEQARSEMADQEAAGGERPDSAMPRTRMVAPEAESLDAQPLKSHHRAGSPPPSALRMQPRMMLQSEPRGGQPNLRVESAAAAPVPLAVDAAPATPPRTEMAPMAAGGAAPRIAEAAPRASADARPRMLKAAAAPAEASPGSLGLEPPPLRARYLLRRQISTVPSMKSARAAANVASTDVAPPTAALPTAARAQLIVSTLRKDQLDAALQWWRQRAPVAATARKPPAIDPNTQVLAVAGTPAALAKLSADWERYVQQLDGQTRRQPLALTAVAATNAADAVNADQAADAAGVADADVDGVRASERPATSPGMLAIEFRLVDAPAAAAAN
ncbi:hypothetical protein [Roseimaritima ulvae]|uniref:Zinc-finger domain-containing protein n=1 Tax=Roseimaritima ulvae TaxID=980254 RepID=A0A5B9QZL2_9BACT|nr:hypothetical protein [Roseimaritima ulvae]QEG39433.1 hypothetical protein UC8_14280 [Roseimaritima ulvae]